MMSPKRIHLRPWHGWREAQKPHEEEGCTHLRWHTTVRRQERTNIKHRSVRLTLRCLFGAPCLLFTRVKPLSQSRVARTDFLHQALELDKTVYCSWQSAAGGTPGRGGWSPEAIRGCAWWGGFSPSHSATGFLRPQFSHGSAYNQL